MKYPLVFSKGHYVFDINGKSMILDTGSPFSFFFEESGSLEICGKTFPLPAAKIPGMKENTEKLVDEKIDGFIGLDIISQFAVIVEKDIVFFDFAEFVDEEQLGKIDNFREYHKDHGTIEFKSDYTVSDKDAIEVPLRKAMQGGWMFDAEINGRKVNAVLDTGAANSYVASSVLAGLNQSGTTEDYFALIGRWNVSDVYTDVETKIAGHDFKLRICANPIIKYSYNIPEDTAVMSVEKMYFDTFIIDIPKQKMILI